MRIGGLKELAYIGWQAGSSLEPIGHSIQVKSALVQTRSTRLKWTNFLDSYKAGRAAKAPAIAAQGIAMVAAVRGSCVSCLFYS